MSCAKLSMSLIALVVTTSVSGCFGGGDIKLTCDEPQLYQAAVETNKVVVPDSLDPLEEFREMPIPKAESKPRPAGLRCIEAPPQVTPK
ncbi:MAG: hypothetical protein K0U72_05200 [Gammaproteobacteria bacterium]|nr:hypothetical protein [Gammaproteobacteria bacterium]